MLGRDVRKLDMYTTVITHYSLSHELQNTRECHVKLFRPCSHLQQGFPQSILYAPYSASSLPMPR